MRPESIRNSSSGALAFGPFVLLPDGRLFRDAREVMLSPKEAAVLRELAHSGGRLVTKEHLLQTIWREEAVGDGSLFRAIGGLRRELGRTPAGDEYIETRHRVGYRLSVPLTAMDPANGAGGAPAARIARALQTEPRVYEAWLEARTHFRSRSSDRMARAIALYRRALEWDPEYAPAMVGLGECYFNLAAWTVLSTGDASRLAAPLVAKAHAVAPYTPGLLTLEAAMASCLSWRFSEADSRFERALREDTADATAWLFYGRHLLASGRAAHAVDALQRSVELDPLSPPPRAFLGYALWFTGKRDEAMDVVRQSLALEPASVLPLAVFAPMAAFGGYPREAYDASVRNLELSKGLPLVTHVHAYVCARAGREDEARGILARADAEAPALGVSLLAFAAFALGDVDEAVKWLARGVAERCVWLPTNRFDPRMAPFAADARVRAVLDPITDQNPTEK